MFRKKIKRKLDQFRVKEDGYFYIQQKIRIQEKNIFSGEIKNEYHEWETLFNDCILYLDGKTVGFGQFKSIEHARKGIRYYREKKGWAKKSITYHEA